MSSSSSFPTPPFPSFTWGLTQHMGVVDEKILHPLLQAAATHSNAANPAAEITRFIETQGLLTPNYRSDSGRADAWRDYQQILSELGLIFSTRIRRRITLTPLGYAFLDGDITFPELITLQALRYQYPNGHKLRMDSALRSAMGVDTLAELQAIAGVQIRPAVLVWRVLRELEQRNERARLTVDEIQCYLMRCSTHADTAACVNAIIAARKGGVTLSPMSDGRRNAQDWIKFLLLTPLFDGDIGADAEVWISPFATDHGADIDALCDALEADASFWKPGKLDTEDRLSWYANYGSIDMSISLIPQDKESLGETATAVQGDEDEERSDALVTGAAGQIALRSFDPNALRSVKGTGKESGVTTIDTSYDAGLVQEAHRLHDLMVILIGNTCRTRGARVYDDPKSVDLIADYKATEFIIEVKSVNPRNFLARVRYALGQVQHYDYLRASQTSLSRRKVIALTAQVPETHWCVPFLRDHMDMDLISFQGRQLHVESNQAVARELFAPL